MNFKYYQEAVIEILSQLYQHYKDIAAGSCQFEFATYSGILVNLYCDGIRGIICLVENSETFANLDTVLSHYHPENDEAIKLEVDDHLKNKLLIIRDELLRALNEKTLPVFAKVKSAGTQAE